MTISTTKFGSNVLRVVASGAKGGFAVDPLSLPLMTTVDLEPGDDSSGACSDANFVGPAPLPICTLAKSGTRLTCR